ncbi:MAG: DUF4091 domain-containing protein [Woeseiaceae bacterium]
MRVIAYISAIFLASVLIFTANDNPDAQVVKGESSCKLTIVRTLDSDGSFVEGVSQIHVARGEKESILILAPANDAIRLNMDLAIAVDAPLAVEAFRLHPVNIDDAPAYDVMIPAASDTADLRSESERLVYVADIDIPVATEAGNYDIELDIGDCGTTVQFRVHDVVLPATDDLIVQTAIDPHATRAQLFDISLKYGINSFAGLFPRLFKANVDSADSQATLAELDDFLSNPQVRHFRLPVSQYHRNNTYADRFGDPEDGEAFAKRLNDELYPYTALLENADLRHKLIIKLWDEPIPVNYPEVATLYSAARMALPGILLELAEQPEPTISDAADIWTIHNDYLLQEDVTRQHANGNLVLVYVNKLQSIQRPSDAMRRTGWIMWNYDLDGYHFWRLNWWNVDHWSNRSSWKSDFDKTGTFVYLAANDEIFASLRLLSFREGLEDARLLRLAEECADNQGSRVWLDSVRPLGIADAETDAGAALYAARDELLVQLESC